MLRLSITLIAILSIFQSYAQEQIPYDFELSEQEITYEQNRDSTLTKHYHSNGQTLEGTYRIVQNDSSVHISSLKKGLLDGTSRTYYKTGELEAERTYDMGIQNGLSIWYFKKGGKKRSIPFKNNEKYGLCTWYYQSGQALKECTYVGDKEEGVCKWYFAKGSLKWLVTYERGVKNGNVQKYKNDGTQEFNGYFLNDAQVNKTVFDRAQEKQ